ncbi:MAG: hypothetical protein CMH83_09170 [Nocardioides sp.]|nr:hypothetical protein [Nocardioides sp.]
MKPEIHALINLQDGLITRRQAEQHGMTADRVQRLVRAGSWVLVRKGVYADASAIAAATDRRTRRLLEDRAASLRISVPHVMSHESAAYELGMQVLHPRTAATHVTRPGVVGSHLRHGVKHHLAPYRDVDVVEVGRRRVLGRARTAVDIAREHGTVHGVVAMDDALRSGVSRTGLVDAQSIMTSWPHVTTVREAIELADTDADSPGETLLRLVVTELGHGRPQSQFGLTREGRTAWCDLRLGRHVFEFDGAVKYRRRDEGGLADVSVEEVVFAERRREIWLQGFRIGISRVVWDDLWGSARSATLERLRAEYEQTCRLYGTDISDLAQFRPRGPRPRPDAWRAVAG